VQKRSYIPAKVEYAPICLPDEFPVEITDLHWPSPAPVEGLHQHDCLELGFCHSGAGVFIIEEKVLPFSAGDVSIISHREMHRARSSPQAISSWSYVMLEPARLLSTSLQHREVLRSATLAGDSFPNIFGAQDHPEISWMTQTIIKELRNEKPGYKTVIRGLVMALMGLLHRLVPELEAVGLQRSRGQTDRIAPALEFMARNYDRPIAIPELARLCFASGSNFRRLFKAATGRSPLDYLTYLRIQMARALLESSNLSVLEISLRSGFQTLSSFNRHFLKIAKCSPRQLRGREKPQN
jgi:AraC family transcriptional regulator, activator of mtrCDE